MVRKAPRAGLMREVGMGMTMAMALILRMVGRQPQMPWACILYQRDRQIHYKQKPWWTLTASVSLGAKQHCLRLNPGPSSPHMQLCYEAQEAEGPGSEMTSAGLTPALAFTRNRIYQPTQAAFTVNNGLHLTSPHETYQLYLLNALYVQRTLTVRTLHFILVHVGLVSAYSAITGLLQTMVDVQGVGQCTVGMCVQILREPFPADAATGCKFSMYKPRLE